MLPFSLPPYISKSTYKHARLFGIWAIGLASDEIIGVTIDEDWALEQVHPSYDLVLIPLKKQKTSYSRILYYADCFAYEHEIPTLAVPDANTFRHIKMEHMLDRKFKRIKREDYFRDIAYALENLVSIRFGPGGFVGFNRNIYNKKIEPGKPIINLPYTLLYENVVKEIHLYSQALKQLDVMAEYLHFYRIIESLTGDNGKKWLVKSMERLLTYKFGMVPCGQLFWQKRRKNLFTYLQRYAAKHLQNLHKSMKYSDIAKRFYNVNRCGIAHGRDIRRVDYALDFQEVYSDNYIVKLMARIIIEDRMKGMI